VKASLELNLARHVKANKKGFHKYIINQRETRETMDLLPNGVGELLTNHTEKVKVLDTIFACLDWQDQPSGIPDFCNQRERQGRARQTYPQWRRST